MHVGLNLVFLVPGETGGMEVYARELIPRLVAAAPDWRFTAFVNREAAAAGGGPWGEIVESVTVPVKARHRIEWVRGEQQLLPPLAHRSGIELLHSLASTAPAWGRFQRVVTIHDLNYRIVPDAHFGIRGLGMRLLVPLAARRSDRIIAVSGNTRDDLERLLHISPAKVDVVPHGTGAELARATPEAEIRRRLAAGDRAIVLSVSAKRPSKNLVRLIAALSLIPPDRRPLLVIPGYPSPYESVLHEHAKAAGVQRDIRVLGWVSAEELEGLYAASACFVFPSLYEGFGFPVLEAMRRGLPVACSDRGSLAEVAGEAALYFNPESESAIAAAVRRLLEDTQTAERLRVIGRQRAARFTWEATAAGTLASYERAAAASR